MNLTYSNPRREATFTDWPYGRDMKTTATFTVETTPGYGQRVARVTLDPKTGRRSLPKRTTYALGARIVDGSDGKTYVANLTPYGFIGVMQSNLQISQETVPETDPRYAAMHAMFD